MFAQATPLLRVLIIAADTLASPPPNSGSGDPLEPLFPSVEWACEGEGGRLGAGHLAPRQGRGCDSAAQSRGRPAGQTGLGSARGAPAWAARGVQGKEAAGRLLGREEERRPWGFLTSARHNPGRLFDQSLGPEMFLVLSPAKDQEYLGCSWLMGGLNVGEFRKVLMKTGLVLVVLGHVSFIAAAVLHGTMLRFVAAASDAVVLQYCVVDILSVTSAIVRWAVFSLSVACGLLSLTCALGLLASIAVTFATQGRALLAACTFESPELPTLAPDCPFDPTRIYSSSLCLWAISLMFCVAESVSAVRCAQLVHRLLELKPWWGKSCHHTGSLLQRPPTVQTPERGPQSGPQPGRRGRGSRGPVKAGRLRAGSSPAQNWEALLGSHCSRRTIEGSLLAPRMNSSSDSLPVGRRKDYWRGEGSHETRQVVREGKQGRPPTPTPDTHRHCLYPFGGRFSQSSFPGSIRPQASSSRTKPSCKWPMGDGGREGRGHQRVRRAALSPHPDLGLYKHLKVMLLGPRRREGRL
ncbi:transmembrane protein 54 [Cricetulus griseus]